MNRQTHQPTDFTGFNDFVEVFRSGTHVDSQGRQQTWTNADLDAMVANHTPAPIVIGHPKANHPAYGWTDALRRVGNVLQAKFTHVEPAFSQMVKDRRFPNRSIRILKNDNGLQLGHVGFLGAAPPAIEGLAAIEFTQSGEVFDFDGDWQAPGLIGQLARAVREFIIEKFSSDDADKFVPNDLIDTLAQLAEQERTEALEKEGSESVSDGEDLPMINFTKGKPMDKETKTAQALLDKSSQQAADFALQNKALQQQLDEERNKRFRSENQVLINQHIARGVKPADLDGVLDFMLLLGDADNVFEFTRNGATVQTVKINTLDFFKSLLNKLPATVKLGEMDFSSDGEAGSDFVAASGTVVDGDKGALHRKALAYQQQHKVDYVTAVKAVGGK